MKTKANTRKSCYCLTLVFIILLIGCSPSIIIVERNITINRTINHTIYRNNTIIIPCNQTEIDTTIYDKDYVLGLIRQLKYYERQQDKYFNDSECNWELNKSNNDLKECKRELCDNWNSSWC